MTGRYTHLSFVDGNDGTYRIMIEGENTDRLNEDREVRLPRRFDREARERLMHVMCLVAETARCSDAIHITVDSELEHALLTQNIGFDQFTQEFHTF